ncbi:putative conserved transmembrane alanine rich protein [Mycobacterium kansasii]|uniref:Putative conserved transmembrane alanine rich protein n=1 Tax=Mycobacterium kansasii TaxID=1768 RepID=A0A1V3XUU2_MYCKA|nr:putative conserved transmembrane alanine rich protein [Mycobacterium kansasii]
MLAGGAALAALGVVVSACGESTPKPPAVDELLAPLEQARRDSALASAAAAAIGNPPQIAAALTVVASQRGAHARALATEIARAAGKLVSATSETSSSSASPSPTDTEPRPATAGVRRGGFAAQVGRGCQSPGCHGIGLPRRSARLHRRFVYGVLHGGPDARRPLHMTSSEPSFGPAPSGRPPAKMPTPRR